MILSIKLYKNIIFTIDLFRTFAILKEICRDGGKTCGNSRQIGWIILAGRGAGCGRNRYLFGGGYHEKILCGKSRAGAYRRDPRVYAARGDCRDKKLRTARRTGG